MIDTWQFLKSSIQSKLKAILLYVVESSGSSPGRKGFIMAINSAGAFNGTIGGGIMEVKLIELAKELLKNDQQRSIIKRQHHDKNHARNQSGMICSGEQVVALTPMSNHDLPLINTLITSHKLIKLNISDSGISINLDQSSEHLDITSQHEFNCITTVKPPRRIHIFGGGHVGQALTRQMNLLGYRVVLYDDRPDVLSGIESTAMVITKVVDYQNISRNLEVYPADLAAIVSFGYRSDKVIFQEIHQLPFDYIGMMGSDQKIATLKKEFISEGISSIDDDHIFMPIGQPIYSQTAAEIAVSIAAQIILEKNKHLPNGRNYSI